MRQGLSYDDVLIVPRFSDIGSRQDPTTRTLATKRVELDHPIIAANMDTVCESQMALAMANTGGLGVLHRFMSPRNQAAQCMHVSAVHPNRTSAAVGVDDAERIEFLVNTGVRIIVVDIAHGHSRMAVDTVKHIKDKYPEVDVMAGNVATSDAVRRLEDAGADAVKVGIGPGAACITRTVAGVGVPQLTAIQDCATAASVPICADGGIKTPGDVAKAMAAGASTVMVGSMFAGADEAPGDETEYGEKVYRGMASTEAQVERHELDEDEASEIVAEGVSGYVEVTGPVKLTVNQLVGGLRSSMTYVGANDLAEFRRNTEFIQVTNAGIIESGKRI